jgi:hypothetical protein
MAARVREVVWAESARDALDEVITSIALDVSLLNPRSLPILAGVITM